jgi:hypothetical protein
MENLYVEPPQFATLLLPLDSTVFHPDGSFPGQWGGKRWKLEPRNRVQVPARAEEEI